VPSGPAGTASSRVRRPPDADGRGCSRCCAPRRVEIPRRTHQSRAPRNDGLLQTCALKTTAYLPCRHAVIPSPPSARGGRPRVLQVLCPSPGGGFGVSPRHKEGGQALATRWRVAPPERGRASLGDPSSRQHGSVPRNGAQLQTCALKTTPYLLCHRHPESAAGRTRDLQTRERSARGESSLRTAAVRSSGRQG